MWIGLYLTDAEHLSNTEPMQLLLRHEKEIGGLHTDLPRIPSRPVPLPRLLPRVGPFIP